MERLEILVDLINETLEKKKKRHIVEGILMSVSLFFSGLAITVITINKEVEQDYE